jgi:hypothetical protein
MNFTARFVLGLALSWTAGCTNQRDAAAPMVKVRAEKDLACAGEKIDVSRQLGGRYRATGCGRNVTYDSVCQGIDCHVTKSGDEAPAWRGRPDPGAVGDPR